jgi:cobalt-zinc-cadmium efflux system protein
MREAPASVSTAPDRTPPLLSSVQHGCDRRDRRRLSGALVLIAAYLVAEIVGGWWAGSLALLADAGHMFSDAAALGLSLFAASIAARPPDKARTFGYRRAEILAALANGVTLVAVSAAIVVEAVGRLAAPTVVQGPLMLAVAVGGLIVNLVALGGLERGHTDNLNVRAASLHVLGDALGSVGAILAAVAVWAAGWHWADAVASILIAGLVVYSSWALIKEAVGVLMESAPARLDVDEVRAALRTARGVIDVHRLHIWMLAPGVELATAHVDADPSRDAGELLRELHTMLRDRFAIEYATIQIEPPSAGETLNCGPGAHEPTPRD